MHFFFLSKKIFGSQQKIIRQKDAEKDKLIEKYNLQTSSIKELNNKIKTLDSTILGLRKSLEEVLLYFFK